MNTLIRTHLVPNQFLNVETFQISHISSLSIASIRVRSALPKLCLSSDFPSNLLNTYSSHLLTSPPTPAFRKTILASLPPCFGFFISTSSLLLCYTPATHPPSPFSPSLPPSPPSSGPPAPIPIAVRACVCVCVRARARETLYTLITPCN